MTRYVHVLYQANGTTNNDWFVAEHSCVTLTPWSTVVSLTEGRDGQGRGVKDAVYRDTPRIIVYTEPAEQEMS